jgi:hypothetical protein
MSETGPTDPEETAFSNLLESGIQDLREQRGPCPASNDLLTFHEGRMPEEEAGRVRDHVEACGLCDAALGNLKRGYGQQPPMLGAIWTFLKKPLLPYALVALLCVPAYRGFTHLALQKEKKPETASTQRRESVSGVVPVPSISLDVVRSDSQAQNPPVAHLLGKDEFFLLSFFVPIKSPPYRYEFVIVARNQEPVVPAQPLENCTKTGNCFLLCNRALFSPGRFEVRITEIGPTGSKMMLPFFVYIFP